MGCPRHSYQTCYDLVKADFSGQDGQTLCGIGNGWETIGEPGQRIAKAARESKFVRLGYN